MKINIGPLVFLDLLLLALFGLVYWGSKTDSVRAEFGGGLLDSLVVFTALMLALAVIMGIREILKFSGDRLLNKTIRDLEKHQR